MERGPWGFDCSNNSGGSTCQYSGGAHALHSKEHQSCALSEGLAHFIATDVFNSHSESDGYFHYYKSGYPDVVDVEDGPVGGPPASPYRRFMEQVCNTPFAGYGVELDWLRTFWDYHTDTASTPPTHYQIMLQVDAAFDAYDGTEIDIYPDISEAAMNETVWRQWAQHNGIDH